MPVHRSEWKTLSPKALRSTGALACARLRLENSETSVHPTGTGVITTTADLLCVPLCPLFSAMFRLLDSAIFLRVPSCPLWLKPFRSPDLPLFSVSPCLHGESAVWFRHSFKAHRRGRLCYKTESIFRRSRSPWSTPWHAIMKSRISLRLLRSSVFQRCWVSFWIPWQFWHFWQSSSGAEC
jgi:hypothetical protein